MPRHSAGGVGTFVHIIHNVRAQLNGSGELLHSYYKQEAKIFSEKQKGFRDGLSYSTLPKQGEMPLPSLGPIPFRIKGI